MIARRLPICLLVLGLAAAGCSDGGSGGAAPAVSSETMSFVDPTRPTAATASSPGASSRTLATDVYVPVGKGALPLVVVSHGLKSHPSRFARLLEGLARAGFVAAAPAYPLTNSSAPEGGDHADDVFNQPADLSFVIGALLREGEREGGSLAGRIDPARIALVGSSLGAITSLGTAYDSCCRDPRVGAVVSISGFLFPFPGDYDISGAALLLMHGDADPTLPYSSSVAAYAAASPPKAFVTLLGGGHDIEAFGFDTASPQQRFDQFFAIVLDFLDLTVRGQAGARDRLVADATIDGSTRLEIDTGAQTDH